MCRSILLLALVPLSAPLIAQGGTSVLPRAQFIVEMDGQFRRIDADKDGLLTAIEIDQYQKAIALADAAARNRALFASLDTDRNGAISPAEFARVPAAPVRNDPQTLLRFDSGRDGRVSLIEHRAGTLANFDRLDSDKDGNVSPAEFRAGAPK